MPRNVRNFWLVLEVDGKRARVETGPISKSGGFKLVVLQRDKGSVVRTMEVEGTAKENGQLVLSAYAVGQDGELHVTTER
jgi:hypothetical protein